MDPLRAPPGLDDPISSGDTVADDVEEVPKLPGYEDLDESPEDSGLPGGPLPDDGFLRGAPPRGPLAPEVP
eukprot:10365592-Alexandrium_andersonii.AAC.1